DLGGPPDAALQVAAHAAPVHVRADEARLGRHEAGQVRRGRAGIPQLALARRPAAVGLERRDRPRADLDVVEPPVARGPHPGRVAGAQAELHAALLLDRSLKELPMWP